MFWRKQKDPRHRGEGRKRIGAANVHRNRRTLMESLESRSLMAADLVVADEFVRDEAKPIDLSVEVESIQLMDVSLLSVDGTDSIAWLQESKTEIVEVDLKSVAVEVDLDVDLEARDKAFYVRSFSSPDESTVEDGVITVAYTDDINPEIYYSIPLSGLGDEMGSIDNLANDFQWDWHNAVFPTDVDGDGSVEPNDVMLVLDVLNNFGRAAIFSLEENSMSSMTIDNQMYFDVNHDDEITPSDVLMIIEYLGENPPAVGGSSVSIEESDASQFAPEVGRIAHAIDDETQFSLDDTKETVEDSESLSSDLFATRMADVSWFDAAYVAEGSNLEKIGEVDSDIVDLALSDDLLFDSVA